jgi:hypothetical protein
MRRRVEAENEPSRPKLVPASTQPPQKQKRKKWILIATGVVGAVILIFAIILAVEWPFTGQKVTQDLADASASKVQITNYRAIYFPHPGGIAEGVVFRHGNISTPLITIQKLTIRGSYLGLISKHVTLLRADGMRVVLPPFGTDGSWSSASSGTVVDEFIADKSVLEIPSNEPGKKPLQFQIHEFSIHALGSKHAMDYHTALTNPEPPGEIRSEGKIGPWKTGSLEQSPVAGSYTFEHANLGAFKGIAGMLSSKGSFHGTFRELDVEGNTQTPDFSVTRSGHQHNLVSDFRATVNATNGDVVLQGVNARLDNTTLAAHGSVAGQPGQKGKTTSLEIVVRDGRIQDLMLLFVRQKRSPLNGEISFHAQTQIPPGQAPFLKKVRLRGDFGVDAAHFTSSKTQQSMEKLSKSARGHPEDTDPARVMSGLKGHVDVGRGVATFTNLFFEVPGAAVDMHGTYGLMNERVDLHGTMRMQAKPSQATTGVKSFLMKVLDPFTNKDRGRVPIPVSITGTYDHPDYRAGTPK